MTYKDLVDRIMQIANSHLMVELVGYGNLSDIEVPDNEEPPDYPYVFLNPVTVSNDRREFNLTMNLICMTQVKDRELCERQASTEISAVSLVEVFPVNLRQVRTTIYLVKWRHTKQRAFQ